MKSRNRYYVYILASKRYGTLYVGVTNNLQRRMIEHKEKLVPGFTKTYSITRLVYCEEFSDPRYAIEREKQMKGWLRKKKIALIESQNPTWKEIVLYINQITGILFCFARCRDDIIYSEISC